MGLSTTPARGVGASDCYFAIVRNAATFPRDVELHYDASEATVKAFKGAAIEVPGRKDVAFKESGVVRLPNMQPGENRWIGLRFPAAAGRAGQVFAVNFHEVVEGVPINGFAIGARIAAMDKVIREKLERHRSELTRLAGSGVEQAAESAKLAEKLGGSEKITPAAYLKFVTEQQGALKAGIKSLADAAKHFKLTAAMTSLTRAIASKDVAAVAVSHDCVLNRIDSALTMQQIAEGDVANILHNVRWQQNLFRTLPRLSGIECAPKLVEASENFVQAYGMREVSNRDYPKLMRSQLKCLSATAEQLKDKELQQRVGELEQNLRGDLAKLQKAHQDYLQRLDGLSRG